MNTLFAVLTFCFSFFGLTAVAGSILGGTTPSRGVEVVTAVSFLITLAAFILGVSLRSALAVLVAQ